MRALRRHRTWISGWLIAVLLFTPLATAAYTCPQLAPAPADVAAAMAAMPDCDGSMAVAMDPDPPQLCKAHCEAGKTSVNSQVAAPDAPRALAVGAALVGIVDVAEAAQLVASMPASVADVPPVGSPPLYLSFLVLRNEPADLRPGAPSRCARAAFVPAASALPDPRLSVNVENLAIAGPDRWSTTRDGGTMQRIALMQEMPNRAKGDAREQAAQARIERDRATLAATELAVRREAGLVWLAVHFAAARLAQVAGLQRENRLLQDTLPARIAAGSAMPAELTMARQ